MPRKAQGSLNLERDWKKRADDLRAEAAKLPPGPKQDQLLKTARQLDTAAHMNDWLRSPGLASPST